MKLGKVPGALWNRKSRLYYCYHNRFRVSESLQRESHVNVRVQV